MDAAWHVRDSSSPYQWHTYRYSPRPVGRSLLELSDPRLRLVMATLLTLTFYYLYGHDFLEHTYITRQDLSKSKFFCFWLR